MSYECQYCHTIFTRAYTLRQHQLKTKYCLALQQACTCKYCGKELSRKDSLRRHKDSCGEYRKSKNNELDERIERLTGLVEKILVQPGANTNVNNRNLVTNLQPVVEEVIEAMALDYLTIDDIKKGVDGLVSFVLTYPLNENVVCTDKSRKKIKYKDAEGNIVNDLGGIKLSRTFFKAINPHNQELIRNEYDSIHEKVQEILSRGAAHDENVAELMMEAMQIQTLAAKCDEIAQGGDNEVRVDFVNRLTKQL